jgi:hypothetical protein
MRASHIKNFLVAVPGSPLIKERGKNKKSVGRKNNKRKESGRRWKGWKRKKGRIKWDRWKGRDV